MAVQVRKVYPFTPTFRQVASLYEAAFPACERLPLWQLSWNGLKKGQEFLAYYDKQTFIGLTYTIYTDSLVYLLFLAVEESKQSQGYGSQILAQVKKEAGVCPCVLTIEPMDDPNVSNRAQRLKRLAFYEKNDRIETLTKCTSCATARLLFASGFVPAVLGESSQRETSDILKILIGGAS